MTGRLEQIEAIIFDMDGLLFDSERIVQRSWNDVGERLGFSLWEIISTIRLG